MEPLEGESENSDQVSNLVEKLTVTKKELESVKVRMKISILIVFWRDLNHNYMLM